MTCYKGQHLFVHKLGFTHHGLGTEDGRVVHYAGKGTDGDKRISITSLEDFACGSTIQIRMHGTRRFDEAAAVERAMGRLNEDGYNLLFNNCEHFVNWCIEGEHRSDQMRNARNIASAAAALHFAKHRNVKTTLDLARLASEPARVTAARQVAATTARCATGKAVGRAATTGGIAAMTGSAAGTATTTSGIMAVSGTLGAAVPPVGIALAGIGLVTMAASSDKGQEIVEGAWDLAKDMWDNIFG